MGIVLVFGVVTAYIFSGGFVAVARSDFFSGGVDVCGIFGIAYSRLLLSS